MKALRGAHDALSAINFYSLSTSQFFSLALPLEYYKQEATGAGVAKLARVPSLVLSCMSILFVVLLVVFVPYLALVVLRVDERRRF